MKHPLIRNLRWPFAIAALCMCSGVTAAPPETRQLDERVATGPVPDISILASHCASPYSDRGTYQIPAGYSGAGTSTKAVPAGRFLQLRSVTITLNEADWRGAHLRIQGAGQLAWYPLRNKNGSAVFRVLEDGPLYADGGGRTVSFVSYRARGYERHASGTYAIQGCLLDSIPKWVAVPDARVPRYPKKALTPLEPVELWDGVRRPVQPAGH